MRTLQLTDELSINVQDFREQGHGWKLQVLERRSDGFSFEVFDVLEDHEAIISIFDQFGGFIIYRSQFEALIEEMGLNDQIYWFESKCCICHEKKILYHPNAMNGILTEYYCNNCLAQTITITAERHELLCLLRFATESYLDQNPIIQQLCKIIGKMITKSDVMQRVFNISNNDSAKPADSTLYDSCTIAEEMDDHDN